MDVLDLHIYVIQRGVIKILTMPIAKREVIIIIIAALLGLLFTIDFVEEMST